MEPPPESIKSAPPGLREREAENKLRPGGASPRCQDRIN
nr:MAG TPA: hypothetical protein [Caudoviricetes sp.]